MYTGTLLYTWLRGERFGTDESGNRYYRNRKGRRHGRERRWVMFKGPCEASKVPPEWHAWLHHTCESPLNESAAQAKPWQRDHRPNMTGTAEAHLPKGHDFKGGRRAAASGDYQAWIPPRQRGLSPRGV